MECQPSAGALIQALLDHGKQFLRLHPHDVDRARRIAAFLDAFERLDSEAFIEILHQLPSVPERRIFREVWLRLREVL